MTQPVLDTFIHWPFDSPQGHSKVKGPQFGRWRMNGRTHTTRRSHRLLFPKLSTQPQVKCCQLSPIPVKFVHWPLSTWLWLQMASSHPAARYWTTGCFKDRKSRIKTLYHLLPMKYWFCSLGAFNLSLGDIYFLLWQREGGHIVSLLHLPGCNNST